MLSPPADVDGHRALRRHAVERQLPADDSRDRVDRGRRRRDRGERPDARDAGRDAVEPLGLGADDREVDPARAALEDLAVLVDEEVVADVVPAVVVAVVARDAEHDRRRVLRPVLVRVDRVVHERELDLAVGGTAARRHAVAAPLGAGDDRRRADLPAPCRQARQRGAAAGGAGGRARSHEARAQGTRAALDAAAGTRRRRRSRPGRCRSPGGRCQGRGRRPRAAPSSASSRRRACARGPAPARGCRAPSPGRSGRSASGAAKTRVVCQPVADAAAPAGEGRSSEKDCARGAAATRAGRSAPSAAVAAPSFMAWRRVRRGTVIGTRRWFERTAPPPPGRFLGRRAKRQRAQSGQLPRSTTSCPPMS